MKVMIIRFLCVLALLPALACSSSSGKKEQPAPICVDVLPGCLEATGTVCLENYLRSCDASGTSYLYEQCYGRVCRTGSCVTAACSTPGESTCVDTLTRRVCSDDTSSIAEITCGKDQVCRSGACVDVPCVTGTKACGWNSVLTCDEFGENWEAERCGTAQYCDPETTKCRKINEFCVNNALGRRCNTTSSLFLCQPGGSFTTETCPQNEICLDGFCQERLCGVSYGEDTSKETDTVTGKDTVPGKDTVEDIAAPEISFDTITFDNIPGIDTPFEKLPEASVNINGASFVNEHVDFQADSKALYLYSKKMLQIKMTRDTYIVEILLEDIEIGTLAAYSISRPSNTIVKILFNDGTELSEEVQWKYVSRNYWVILEEFGDVGGRVRGTFAGILEDMTGGPAIEFSNGSFDLPRKQ